MLRQQRCEKCEKLYSLLYDDRLYCDKCNHCYLPESDEYITMFQFENLLKEKNKEQARVGEHDISHYGGKNNKFECWNILWEWGYEDFWPANVIKYVSRAGKKGNSFEDKLRDLHKAEDYLVNYISRLTEREQQEKHKKKKNQLENL